MNNRQLTIFRTVCEEGSMTKTAEKLYMTQPAVSQTIKELEQESGVCFLERYNRKVVPTESGRLLYQYACHILGLYQDLEQHLKETEGVRTIRIGANLSVGVKMLRGFIRAFEKKYPDIQVKVTVSGSVRLMELLKTHQIDLGLMEDLPGETDYIQEPFAKDRTLIVAAPDHPLAGKEHVRFEDLKKENFLLREKGAGVRDRFEAILRTKDCVIDPLWESRSTKVLVQAVEDGFGISVLPYCLIEEYLKEGRLAEIKVEDLCLERNLKYRQEHKEELKAYFRRRNRMYSYKMSRRKDKSICTYPQYECCGYKNCKLYHICSQLKITNRTTDEIEKDKVTL